MTANIDEDFLYVTNSFRRVDIIRLLASIGFARNYEIADILCIKRSYVSTVLKDLSEHEIITSAKTKQYAVYSLTEKGKKINQKLENYYGIK